MLAYGRGRWAVSQKLYREKITSRIPKVLPPVYLRLKWYEYGLQFYPGGGGVLLGTPGGGVPHGSPNTDTLSDQKMSFFPPIFRPSLQSPYPFSNLASTKLCHHYLDSNTNEKDFFLYYLFETETMNTFIHYRKFLETHIRFQTKMGEDYTRFKIKTAQ